MSSIDERVVQMKFQNGQFESGIKTSLSSLEALKKGLNLDGAKKGLSELSSVANGVKLNGLSDQVAGLSSKFEGLRAIGVGALMAIGSKVVDLGVQFAKNLGENMIAGARDGLAEYETQINAIQTIMSNTASKGTTMDQVNAALAELNTYADKTIYNFAEMTRNIGTFTAAGVGLETATDAIKGIANLAAVSGSNSQQASTAMYQLSQAMASGTVKLMDWNSVVNAGMGGQVFQDELKATARVHGIAVDDLIKKNGSFRESLQEGWLTSTVLTDTLAKFTGDLSKEQLINQGYTAKQADEIVKLGQMSNDAATKVKTFTQLIDTLNEAVGSGWARSWQTVLGDFEEARELFTEVSDLLGEQIQKSADARNAQLEIWKNEGGRTAIINSLRNAFTALMSVVDPIRDAWAEVFPPTWGHQLAEMSKALETFTKGLILNEKSQNTLKEVAKSLFNTIKMGATIIGGIFRVVFNLGRTIWDLVSAFLGLLSPVATFVAGLLPIKDGIGDASENINGFFDMLIRVSNFLTGDLISVLKDAGDAFDAFLNGGDGAAILDRMVQKLQRVGSAIVAITSALFQGTFTDNPFFSEDSPFIKALLKINEVLGVVARGVSKAIGFLGDVLSNVFQAIVGNVQNIDWGQVMNVAGTGVLAVIGILIAKGIKNIVNIFSDSAGLIKTFTTGIGDSIESLTGILSGMQAKLKAEALLKIAISIGLIAAAIAVLALVDPERLIPAVTSIGVAAGILMGALAVMDRVASSGAVAKMPFISASLSLLAFAVNILATALVKLSGLDWDGVAKGLTGIAVSMGLLLGAAKLLKKEQKNMISTGIGLILFATAINILAGAVAIFGNMPMDVLLQGGISLGIVLTALTGAAILLNKFAPSMVKSAIGLTAISVALGLLIVPISAFGLLPVDVLTQGLLAATIVITGLVLAAETLSKSAPKMLASAVGLMAMALAVNMLVAPIALLGTLSLETLITGLIGIAAAMLVLVLAAQAMTSAVVGAAAMLVMAGALFVMGAAITMLATLSMEQVGVALIALAGAFVILGVAALVLAPITPLILALSVALGIMGVGLLAISASVMVFSLGLMLLGPALAIAGVGLLNFANIAGKIAEAVPAFLAIGVGLLGFGVGAGVAAVGVGLLGLALGVLGIALGVIGVTAGIGTKGLTTFIMGIGKMADQMPNMLAMAGVFTVLGGGTAVLGAALLVLTVGALAVGVALAILAPLGMLVALGLDRLSAAIKRIAPLGPKIEGTGKSLGVMSKAVKVLAASGIQAAAGIMLMTAYFAALGLAATTTALLVIKMASSIRSSVPPMLSTVSTAAKTYTTSVATVASSTSKMQTALMSATTSVNSAAGRLVTNLKTKLTGDLKKVASTAGSESQNVGRQITAGLVRGIQNGSSSVTYAARQVALNALAASKRELDIHSPSRATEEIGHFYDQGLANGLMKSLHVVKKAGKTVGNAALTTLSDSLSNASALATADMDMNPTIKPIIDLTAAQQSVNQLNRMMKTQSLTIDSTVASASSARAAYQSVQEQKVAARSQSTNAERVLNYTQINNSPKAISNAEIYRQTKNQLSQTKGALK